MPPPPAPPVAVREGRALTGPPSRAELAAQLRAAGCVAAEEEADLLLHAAAGDLGRLAGLVGRRTGGEPLAWVIGETEFCGQRVLVRPGVFVPRPHSEQLAERAAQRVGARGRAIDLGTGSGAIALILQRRRPRAEVIGTELDPAALACALANGVRAVAGDLFAGIPAEWRGTVTVIVAALPYVPHDEITYLARDARDFEPLQALDGGADGLDLVRRAIAEAPGWLRPGGWLLLEAGGDQPRRLQPELERAGFGRTTLFRDEDGDLRGLEAALR